MGLAWFHQDMTSKQHIMTFHAFLTHPPESTQAWAHAQGFQSTSDTEFQTTLLHDWQVWILCEPCSCSDLVVMVYSDSKNRLFCLPAQGWDCCVAEDAE